MEKTSSTLQGSVWMLIPRFSLVFIYFYLGFKHFFDPESFRRTIAAPESGSNFLRDIFAMPLENEFTFEIFRYFAVGIELLIGLMLLVGFLLRLCGIISSSLTFLFSISLIPNFFLFLLHAIPFLLSIPLIFFNSNRFTPIEKYIPSSWLILQKK